MADRVSIRVRLRTAPAGSHLVVAGHERDIRNVSALQNEVAKAISRKSRSADAEGRRPPFRSREINQQAYESYLKGRYEWYKEVGNRESLERGMSHFRRAIELDPAYAPAWAGLADVLYTMSGLYLQPADAMPRARAAALRALAVDADLPEAHATLAQIQAQYDWDWTGAEKSYQRTIRTDPSYAPGHFYYSQFLAERGRMADAVNQAVDAWRLNPLARNVSGYLAWLCYVDRQPDRAIETFGKVQQLDPVPADLLVGLVYEFKGQFDRAIAEFKGACASHRVTGRWP
jgi:tetratricopeptide (TPR) repeat protein